MCSRKIALCALLVLAAAAVSAGPFGLEMGMTLDEVRQACGGRAPEHIDDIRYRITPLKKHPSFSDYIAWISPTEGLCFIRANSDIISANDTGDRVKGEFHKVEKALSKSYGRSFLIDELSKDSVFEEETYWMFTLQRGERKLEAQWFPPNSDICWIDLFTVGMSYYSAIISLQYEFANYEKAKDEQDSVL